MYRQNRLTIKLTENLVRPIGLVVKLLKTPFHLLLRNLHNPSNLDCVLTGEVSCKPTIWIIYDRFNCWHASHSVKIIFFYVLLLVFCVRAYPDIDSIRFR